MGLSFRLSGKLFSVVFVLLLAVPAWADFLEPRDMELAATLAPPPKPGSPVDQADYAELLALQKSRTRAECERASYEANFSVETLYGAPYGMLTKKEVALLSDLLWEVAGDTDAIVQRAKVLYKRPRPHRGNPSVSPCVRRETTNAYPSGHAAISRVWALTLAEIRPTQAGAYFQRAAEIGHDRVLGGAHHPTDISAGSELGERIFEALHRSERFNLTVKRMQNALRR